MKAFEDTDTRTAAEAGRILMEAHADWLSPKLAAFSESVHSVAAAFAELVCLPPPEPHLLIVPRDTGAFLPFRRNTGGGGTENREDGIAAVLSTLRDAWSEETAFSGYLLPAEGSGQPFCLALALRIGGWENNQPFHGLLGLVWPGVPSGRFPFPVPDLPGGLPGDETFRSLALPPRFERTTERSRTWIAFPARIRHRPEWNELEAAVAVLSEAGAKILDRLVPILGDAAWKSMARRVMHELSRTVAMPQPMLEEAGKALNSALGAIRRAQLPAESGLEDKLVRHLKTVDNNLKELEGDHAYILSKVRWFFYLVAEELRAEAPETSRLHEVLKQAVESLGCAMDTDSVIENPEHPLWQARLKLPRLFPQHCLEAFISNSFLRREAMQPVRFSIGEDGLGATLCWTNRADADNADRLASELAKPPVARSFGLRMTDAISTTFFDAPLEIRLEPSPDGALVRHRLPIPSPLLQPAPDGQTNVSAPEPD